MCEVREGHQDTHGIREMQRLLESDVCEVQEALQAHDGFSWCGALFQVPVVGFEAVVRRVR